MLPTFSFWKGSNLLTAVVLDVAGVTCSLNATSLAAVFIVRIRALASSFHVLPKCTLLFLLSMYFQSASATEGMAQSVPRIMPGCIDPAALRNVS